MISSVANMSANTWNKLPVPTRNAENIAVFKKLLKNNSYKSQTISNETKIITKTK